MCHAPFVLRRGGGGQEIIVDVTGPYGEVQTDVTMPSIWA
jgi:hypothetical protein